MDIMDVLGTRRRWKDDSRIFWTESLRWRPRGRSTCARCGVRHGKVWPERGGADVIMLILDGNKGPGRVAITRCSKQGRGECANCEYAFTSGSMDDGDY